MVLRFFLFAAVFIFISCADVKFNNPYDPESPNYIGKGLSSSASVEHSSSSANVSVVESSSSVVPVTVSSSSSKPSSSSSVPPSSSSVAKSSSSAAVSSSSLTQSSSAASSSSATGGGLVGTSGTFIDSRDGGKTYKWVKIGKQYWMAENLNYNATNSRCYGDNSGGDSQGNCAKYGRLYNWATAMALNASCNSSSCASQVDVKHKGICPNGWHIPSNAEWNVLMKFVNPECSDNSVCAGAGTKLKAADGWNNNGNGEDTYGFSALPGGYGYSVGSFSTVGGIGYWWSASEDSSNFADLRGMYYDDEYVGYHSIDKDYLFSVRCVQD